MNLLLKGLRWHSAGQDQRGDLRLRWGRIAAAGPSLRPRRGERTVDAAGLLALPGLINAHDHLGLDLLPRLGTPPYSNFYQWARAIYHPQASPIREIQAVPGVDRLRFGAYRNLLAGVTTVMHHDPYHLTFRWAFPLRVFAPYGWAHSLGYGGDVVRAFRRNRRDLFFLHAAEGTDAAASAEIDQLQALGLLGARTVLIHAIALQPAQQDLLALTQTKIVWCPTSNLWLYGATAPIDALRGQVEIVLGTDSTLSGPAFLLDELRTAQATGLASPAELLNMVTDGAARLLGLSDGRGTLIPGGLADLVLLPDTGRPAGEVLLSAQPKDLVLVLIAGRPRLVAPPCMDLAPSPPNLQIDGAARWVWGNPTALLARLAQAVPAELLAQNPLWSRLKPLDNWSR